MEPLPLFPLHTVLFPGALLPLHVFEERYRLLVREGHDFGVVLIRSGLEVEHAGQAEPRLHEVGTRATLVRVEALPDGRYHVLARGQERFRIVSLDHSRPYLTAEVNNIASPRSKEPERLRRLIGAYLEARGVKAELQEALAMFGRLAWLAGAVLEAEPAKRQQLLETGSPALAERLLGVELDRRRHLGALGSVQPAIRFPN